MSGEGGTGRSRRCHLWEEVQVLTDTHLGGTAGETKGRRTGLSNTWAG